MLCWLSSGRLQACCQGSSRACLALQHVLLAEALPVPTPSPPAPLHIAAELAYRELGLNKAVATMRRGEVARLWLGPQYGYGEKGSFSFPTVPPSANLV